MDWRKFRKFLTEKYGVTEAFMFIGHMPEHEDMYIQLHEAGYLIVLKPTFDMTRPQKTETPKDKSKETGKDVDKTDDKKIIKGNVDAELVLWAVKEMKNYDKAVIVSGDGDFFSLVEYLEQQHKLHALLAPNAHYSSLYNKFDTFIQRLDGQRRALAYYGSKPSSKHRQTLDKRAA